MPHEYNSEGAESMQDNFTIPDDVYNVEIVKAVEGHSKAGDYQVACNLKVIGGDHAGFEVKFHRVTFLNPKTNPKAAGMSVHFVKSIGEPWEGKFTITPANWVGKKFEAYLEAREFNGFKSMQVKWMSPAQQVETVAPEVEEIPF